MRRRRRNTRVSPYFIGAVCIGAVAAYLLVSKNASAATLGSGGSGGGGGSSGGGGGGFLPSPSSGGGGGGTTSVNVNPSQNVTIDNSTGDDDVSTDGDDNTGILSELGL